MEQGLLHPFVNDLLETSSGAYWVATNGGVCRFNPSERAVASSKSRFKVYLVGDTPATNCVNFLREDRRGIIWTGTNDGLFYLDPAQDRFVLSTQVGVVWALCQDRQGNLFHAAIICLGIALIAASSALVFEV